MINRTEQLVADGSGTYRTAERYQPWSLVVLVDGEVVDLTSPLMTRLRDH